MQEPIIVISGILGTLFICLFFFRPSLAICAIAMGIVFPASLFKLKEINIKILDLVIIAASASALMRIFIGKGQIKLCKMFNDPCSKLVGLGYFFFFIGVLLSCYRSYQLPVQSIKYVVESIESYVLPLLIVVGLIGKTKYLRCFLYAICLMSFLGGIFTLLNPDKAIAVNNASIGVYQGVYRLRGFHSFEFGFVLATGAISSAALSLSNLRYRTRKKGVKVLSIVLLLNTGVISFFVMAASVRTWILALMVGLIVIFVYLRVPIKRLVLYSFIVTFIMVTLFAFTNNWIDMVKYLKVSFDRLLSIQSLSDMPRLDNWRLAWKLYGSKILLGVGGGGAQLPVPSNQAWFADYSDVDNGYLQVLLEIGIIGFLGVFIMVWGTVWMIVKDRKSVNINGNKQLIGNYYAVLSNLLVLAISMFAWNLWQVGATPGFLIGLIIAFALQVHNSATYYSGRKHFTTNGTKLDI